MTMSCKSQNEELMKQIKLLQFLEYQLKEKEVV